MDSFGRELVPRRGVDGRCESPPRRPGRRTSARWRECRSPSPAPCSLGTPRMVATCGQGIWRRCGPAGYVRERRDRCVGDDALAVATEHNAINGPAVGRETGIGLGRHMRDAGRTGPEMHLAIAGVDFEAGTDELIDEASRAPGCTYRSNGPPVMEGRPGTWPPRSGPGYGRCERREVYACTLTCWCPEIDIARTRSALTQPVMRAPVRRPEDRGCRQRGPRHQDWAWRHETHDAVVAPPPHVLADDVAVMDTETPPIALRHSRCRLTGRGPRTPDGHETVRRRNGPAGSSTRCWRAWCATDRRAPRARRPRGIDPAEWRELDSSAQLVGTAPWGGCRRAKNGARHVLPRRQPAWPPSTAARVLAPLLGMRQRACDSLG